jgi:hypothetical protein
VTVDILAGAAFGLAVFAALAALARVGGVRDSDATRRPAWSPRTPRRVPIVAYRTAATPALLEAKPAGLAGGQLPNVVVSPFESGLAIARQAPQCAVGI